MKPSRLAMVLNTRMRPSRYRPPALARVLLLGCLFGLTTALPAMTGGFTATLSSEKQDLAGLATLSAAERTALDQLVAGELAAVRTGGSPEPAGTFVSRRTEAERKAAGLDRLTGAQLEKLDEFVAAALAARPKPKERPRLKESDVLSAARQNQIHGSVTVAYGWGGGGRDLWAESLWLEYYDPASRIGIGVGLANYSGSGLFGYYPGDYYPYGGRYYAGLPGGFDPEYFGRPRGEFNFGDGQSFRGGGGVFGTGGRHGR